MFLNHPTFFQTEMRGKNSPLWDYFKEAPEPANGSVVICQIPNCKTEAKNVKRGGPDAAKSKLNTSALKLHLEKNHPEEYKEFLAKKEDQDNDVKKRKLEVEEESEMECGANKIFNLDTKQKRAKFLESKTKKQTSMESFFPGNVSTVSVGGGRTPAPVPASGSSRRDSKEEEEKRVNLIVITKIVLDMDPFGLMDKPGMVLLMNSAFPKYTVKSRKFYSELLHKVFNNGKEQVKRKLENENISTLAVQMDGWSKFGHGYIGVVVTFITKGWKRVTLAIDTIPFDESHTAPAQAELLQNVLEEWGLVLPFKFLTTDSASNMTAMETYLDEAEMIKCLNHVLQLVIKDEVLEKPQIKELIERIKKFVNYASNSILLSADCRKAAEEIGMKYRQFTQDVPTRWNSTHDP